MTTAPWSLEVSKVRTLPSMSVYVSVEPCISRTGSGQGLSVSTVSNKFIACVSAVQWRLSTVLDLCCL